MFYLANIIIKEENTGVSADKNGNYILKLKANRSVVIEVSFIGYETKSIRIPMLKKVKVILLTLN